MKEGVKKVMKKKALKAKLVSSQLGSKRKLSRMGKKQKKGHRGGAAAYLTRSQCLKRLQITLRDFRRLCILKGIYPREPKMKASASKDKTYYHVKDVSYLAHEPLLVKFREFKAFMKKVRRAVGRKEISEARRKDEAKPTYALDHLVKERYPRFTDAVRDLDDALCLIHLFASLPAERRITSDRTVSCQRLAAHWQHFVAKSHALTKTFVSIKGIYFQAEICGQAVTWLVPHRFTVVLPQEVDFRVMLTFLEFHEVLLKFVLFKLFHGAGLEYPPSPLALGMLTAAAPIVADTDADATAATSATAAAPRENPPSETQRESQRRLHTLDGKLKAIASGDDDEEEEEEALSPEAAAEIHNSLMLATGGDADGDGDDDAAETFASSSATHRPIFHGLKIFLAREAQHSWLEFAIVSCGGVVGTEDAERSPFDATDELITHHIVDRPTVRGHTVASREYVQPQWVVDSINCKVLLPVERYAVGATLPPHLSPFVDDYNEGYVPAYREELDRLASTSGTASVRVDDDNEDGDDDDDEMDVDSGSSKRESQENTEAGDLAKIMMSKKARRLYNRMQHGLQEKADQNARLVRKRQQAESGASGE